MHIVNILPNFEFVLLFHLSDRFFLSFVNFLFGIKLCGFCGGAGLKYHAFLQHFPLDKAKKESKRSWRRTWPRWSHKSEDAGPGPIKRQQLQLLWPVVKHLDAAKKETSPVEISNRWSAAKCVESRKPSDSLIDDCSSGMPKKKE